MVSKNTVCEVFPWKTTEKQYFVRHESVGMMIKVWKQKWVLNEVQEVTNEEDLLKCCVNFSSIRYITHEIHQFEVRPDV